MKQTAVEWLEDCFNRYGAVLKSDFIKAKEMEKQQIVDAHGIKTKSINQDQSELITGRQYYNETFNK
jgi:hypothetical protein